SLVQLVGFIHGPGLTVFVDEVPPNLAVIIVSPERVSVIALQRLRFRDLFEEVRPGSVQSPPGSGRRGAVTAELQQATRATRTTAVLLRALPNNLSTVNLTVGIDVRTRNTQLVTPVAGVLHVLVRTHCSFPIWRTVL